MGDVLLLTGARMVGQLEDVFASELMDELLAGQGVHFEVGCGGDQSADSKQLEFLGDITAENVGVHGPEFFHLGLRDVLGAAVDEESIDSGGLEFPGCLDDPGAGADEKDALRVGGGELETSGDRAGEEAIGGDRPDYDDERERFEELGLMFEAMGEASVFDGFDDLAGEDGGDGGGDDTARCEEAEEDALAHGEAAADGGEQDACGSDEEDEGGDEEESLGSGELERGEVESCGEEDEQAGDEEHAQGFLELEHVVEGDAFLVGESDAEDRDREQSDFRLDCIGGDIAGEADCEQDGAMEEVGDPMAFEDLFDYACYGDGGYSTDEDGESYGLCDLQEGVATTGREDCLEDEHCEDCADGVDDDTFPSGDGSDRPDGFDLAEEGCDYGGAGDDEEGAEQGCECPIEAGDPACGCGGETPGEDDADRAEAEDGFSGFADFRDAEAETAFEEDRCDGEGDEGGDDF